MHGLIQMYGSPRLSDRDWAMETAARVRGIGGRLMGNILLLSLDTFFQQGRASGRFLCWHCDQFPVVSRHLPYQAVLKTLDEQADCQALRVF